MPLARSLGRGVGGGWRGVRFFRAVVSSAVRAQCVRSVCTLCVCSLWSALLSVAACDVLRLRFGGACFPQTGAPVGSNDAVPFGNRVEVKNLNSIKAVGKAIEHEVRGDPILPLHVPSSCIP